jgi:Tfp pilus assembly protein PilO
MSARSRLPKDKLQKIILAGIIALIAVAAMYVFWVSPQLEALRSSRSQIDKLGQEILQLQRKATLGTVNQPLLQQVQAFVEPLRVGTVTGDPYMWVVLQVNQLVEKRAVRVPTPRPGSRLPHTRVAGYDMLPTSLEVEGTYDEIGITVRDFENQFPLGEVRSIELSPVGGGKGQCRASIEVRFLLWPEDKLKVKETPKQQP